MELPVYPVAEISAAAASKDGAHVDLLGVWTDEEPFMLRLPLGEAIAAQLFLMNACAEASRKPGGAVRPAIVRSAVLQPYKTPGHVLLTIEVAGGANLQFLVPEGVTLHWPE